MDRYEVKNWVCDYGIWDNQSNVFIGKPIESQKVANSIFEVMFKGIKS